jgi:hypothetical protein
VIFGIGGTVIMAFRVIMVLLRVVIVMVDQLGVLKKGMRTRWHPERQHG